MSLYRQNLGRKGEKIALTFLRQNNYKIITKNYKNCFGEIDIVAKDQENIVFIEVKTRSTDKFGSPADAVGYLKQKKLYKIAQKYLQEYMLQESSCRFDVVCIKIQNNTFHVEIIKNAF